MSILDKIRDLIATDSKPEAEEPTDEQPVDECPLGGDHEWHEVRAATSRTPLYTYCTKCRQPLPPP